MKSGLPPTSRSSVARIFHVVRIGSLVALIAGLAGEPPVMAAGINLSWDDCGTAGSATKTFSCATNTGVPFSAVASFVPPPGIDEFLGASAILRITSAGASLPSWWKHGSGQCRGATALSTDLNFTSGPFTCADFTNGQGAGGYAYEIGFFGANTARMRIQYAVPFDNRGPLSSASQYYAFKVNLARSASTGIGSCAGCDVPVSIELNSIQLFQPPAVANDPILTNPLDRTVVSWQGSPGTPRTEIRSFSPLSGGAGTPVRIAGLHFTGATSVRFGIREAAFTVVSDSVIDATAPIGVSSNNILVTAPLGTAVSDDIFRVGAPPAGGTGINLAWDDCGAAGNTTQEFACDQNSGTPFTLVASFGPPAGITEFTGLSAQIDIQSNTAQLPDWWKHGVGECRGIVGLDVGYDFTSGPFTCTDFSAGTAAGGFAFDAGFGSPNRARLRVVASVPSNNTQALTAGTEYYAFKVNLQRSRTVSAGSCSGCEVPTCIVLNEIQLFQTPAAGNDPVLSTPIYAQFAWWHGNVPGCPSSTPVQAEAILTEAGPHRVTIVWQTGEARTATIYRRHGEEPWQVVAHALADGNHRITYEDRNVTAGETYLYRLGIMSGTREVPAGETVATVPAAIELAVSGVTWERGAGAVTVSLSLPRGEGAAIEVFDIGGRRWGQQRIQGVGAGNHAVRITGPGQLRSGVYFARLTQGGRSVSRRFAVSD